MEKKIEDYLHLYYGCQAQFDKCDYYLVHNMSIHNGEVHKLSGWLIAHILKCNGYVIAKPLLRPLSDMTEEEADEHDALEEQFDESNTDNKAGAIVTWAAESTRWCLSKGFDLFGLIESGLAIKTKHP